MMINQTLKTSHQKIIFIRNLPVVVLYIGHFNVFLCSEVKNKATLNQSLYNYKVK